MPLYFISDLHLNENQPEITEKFSSFLQKLPDDTEALYILGDLFEVWIGDDEKTAFQVKIAALIKTASMRFPVYFMPGNRDFSIGKEYCQQSGMKYLKDPTVVTLQHTRTLLLHGDSLCTQDRSHQLFRQISRSRIILGSFLALPLIWRKKLAEFLRHRSQRRNQRISMDLMDIHFESLKALMRKFKVRQVIYGHTHRPSIFYFDIHQQLKKVFVLSDWHQLGHALMFDDNHHSSSFYF